MVSKIAHTEFDKTGKAVAKEQRYVLYIWGSNTQFLYNPLVVEITACYCSVVLLHFSAFLRKAIKTGTRVFHSHRP